MSQELSAEHLATALNDRQRLSAVLETGLLDKPSEECFDRLTRLAVKLINVPVSFLSLVDASRDFYVSQCGFGEPLASTRQIEGRTFCHYGLVSDGPLVIDDTLASKPFDSVPTVTSLGVRAYAGIPLMNIDGFTLGSLCVIDFKPRHWTEQDIDVLKELARAAMHEISIRKALADATDANGLLRQLNFASKQKLRGVEVDRANLFKIIDDSPSYIGMADLNGKSLYYNRTALRMLGYPEDYDYSKLRISDVHPEWAAKQAMEQAIPAALSRGFWVGESAIQGRNKRQTPADQTILIHRDETGTPNLVSTVMHDVSESKRAQKLEKYRSGVLQLLVSGAPLEQILESIVVGIESLDSGAVCSILVTDEGGRHLMLGAAPSLPSFYNQAVNGIEVKVGNGSCGSAAASGERVIVEDVRTHPYWRSYAELAVRAGQLACWSEPIKDSNQNILGTFAIYHSQAGPPTSDDIQLITQASSLAALAIERWNKEQELIKYRDHLELLVEERSKTIQVLNQQLVERVREAESANHSKSSFLANMSHEIRTPLNAVMGMTYLLLRSDLTPEQGAKLNKIRIAGDHLLEVINAILDLSKIESGKFTLEGVSLQPAALIGNVYSIVQDRVLEKGLRWHTEVPPLPTNLIGDPTRIQQALLNYVTNAIKFTQSGSITLRACLLDEDDESALIRFEVEDTGVGIPTETLPRLFASFEQADSSTTRKFGGTGLGLAISKKLAQLMGGDAGATSTVGQGSLFWFTVRLKKAAQQSDIDEPSRSEDVETHLRRVCAGSRVLLAEDEPINREIALLLLEDVGIDADIAENGAQAVELATRNAYELILMDMQMPKLDGLEATRQIRKLPDREHVPIVAMTANAYVEDRQRCMDAGMNDFLTKPVDPDELFSTILKWLTRSA